jgi:SAM-dependent methyltransferase
MPWKVGINWRSADRFYILAFLASVVFEHFGPVTAFSWSRRDWIVATTGTAIWSKFAWDLLQREQFLIYPAKHEDHVKFTISKTMQQIQKKNPRVLEVGIGPSWRLLQRGLYDPAFEHLSSGDLRHLSLAGVDLKLPKPVRVDELQRSLSNRHSLQLDINALPGSITETLPFPDGHFDAIICCLTLCSVNDPVRAVQEMRRLLKPDGGTLGYVEHEAVNHESNLQFLAWQQQVLDPLQQALADNCHLHRHTESNIHNVFARDSVTLHQERFLVPEMWPVSYQCCGVIKRIA